MTYQRLGSCPFHPGYAHTPSASYYAYLTTGDRFFEEELAFWGMYPSYVWPHTGILPGTARAAAWQLRNSTDAAFLLPDNHQRKGYLAEYVNRNLADMRRQLDERGHLLSGPRKCSGRQHWVCSGQTSIWQYTWLIWSLDNTSRKGWRQSARIRDDAADVLLRMYDGQETFTAPNGKIYHFAFKGGMPYSLATDLIQVEYGNSECSAALARYDNPRARKMYEFVRKTIEEAPRPDYQPRFRGIEFVK